MNSTRSGDNSLFSQFFMSNFVKTNNSPKKMPPSGEQYKSNVQYHVLYIVHVLCIM